MVNSSKTISPIISLDQFRANKIKHRAAQAYTARLQGLSKLELLEEMVQFQTEREELMEWSEELLNRGAALFERLQDTAETPELFSLSKSYLAHIEQERGRRLTAVVDVPETLLR